MTVSGPSRRTFGQRFLGCLIKGLLGCLAFLAGAAVVFVLFLPAAGGRVVARLLESRFAERHLGTLEMNEAWLPSFYGPQRIDGLSLRDPEGDEILHADLLAPRLGATNEDDSFGPIEIHVDRLDLVEDAQGSTNLARAFAARDPARPPGALRVVRGTRGVRFGSEGFTFDAGSGSITLALSIDRLSFTDALGRGLLLQELVASGKVVPEAEHVRLELSGRARLGRGAAEGVSFRWIVEHLERLGEAGEAPGSTFEVDLSEVPVAELAALFPGVRELTPALGDPIERVRLVLRGEPAGPRLEANVDSRETHLVVAGSLDFPNRRLSGGAGEGARLEFPADSWWSRVALPELLPFADALEVASTNGRAAFVLEDLVLSLRGGWPGFSARVKLEAETVSFAFPPALAAELGNGRIRQALPLSIPIEAGRVRFASFALAAQGGTIAVSGAYDLAARSYLPCILALPPELGGRSFELSGPREDPRLDPVRD